MRRASGFLLPAQPVADLDDYRARGGGEGLQLARRLGPDRVIAEVRASGLRGRGGAGFPTGFKWAGLRQERTADRYVVCNAAEGEPGTFKDRLLMRRDPYQLLEGVAIAALALEASRAFIAVKASFVEAITRLEQAASEMTAGGLLGEVPIDIVTGPDDYLFGEEKALLEVIEGKDPLPRLYPPYVQGLFTSPEGPANPAVVNNVETLSNVPHILREGAGWFASMGTEQSPGTMVFTVSGDVQREAVAEFAMGTPLAALVAEAGGGTHPGRRLVAAVPGVSNRPLPAQRLDTPLSFEGMRAAGSGLGSGGFIIYDDTACMVRAATVLSGFLADSSCGQCPPCKLGTAAIVERFARVEAGAGTLQDLEETAAWVSRVTDANRCGLGGGAQALAGGFLETFWDDFVAHLQEPCPAPRPLRVPRIADIDAAAGRMRYEA